MAFCTIQVTSRATGKTFDYGTENLQWIIAEGSNSALVGADPATKIDVEEDIDTLISTVGNDFVKVTSLAYGVIAINKYYVKKLSASRAGTGVIYTTTNLAIYITETYSAIRPLFADCGGSGSVAVDGSTIVSPGGILSVGTIASSNIQDGSVTYGDIQDVTGDRVLGRTGASGSIEELQLLEGDGMTIVLGASDITFTNNSEAIIKPGATGLLLWDSRSGDDHVFKGLLAGTGINVSEVSSDVVITNTGLITASSVGGGSVNILSGVVSNDVEIKSLAAGSGIGLVDAGGLITISATGAINSVSNVGGGQGVFKQITSGDIELYSLTTSGAIAITLVGDDIQISENLTASNGLTRTSNDYQLGGALTADTVVSGSSFDMSFTINRFVVTANDGILLQANNSTDIDIISTNNVYIRGASQVTLETSDPGTGVINIGDGDDIINIVNKYDLANDTPNSGLGVEEVMVWTGNGAGGATASFKAYGSGGGGVSNTRAVYSLTPPSNTTSVLIDASDTGVTIARDASNELTITIPDGVDIYGGTLHFPTAGNPGTDFILNFEFNGNDAAGNARVSNISVDTIYPPEGRVINKAGVDFGGPSPSVPLTYNRLEGSSLLEGDVIGAPGAAGSGTPLKIRWRNYNASANGGNAQTIFKFKF